MAGRDNPFAELAQQMFDGTYVSPHAAYAGRWIALDAADRVLAEATTYAELKAQVQRRGLCPDGGMHYEPADWGWCSRNVRSS